MSVVRMTEVGRFLRKRGEIPSVMIAPCSSSGTDQRQASVQCRVLIVVASVCRHRHTGSIVWGRDGDWSKGCPTSNLPQSENKQHNNNADFIH